MKTQRLAIALTIINLALTVFLLAQLRRADAEELETSQQTAPAQQAASSQAVAPVLRGRALEIVDTQGRVRASISVQPAVTVDSKFYPETVLLRLTDPKNGPVVKLQAAENGSALGMSDDA
ncbi:MAG TPA: hypothetical protein VGD38_18635, partial [Pyrinomonadaceae bacterium]